MRGKKLRWEVQDSNFAISVGGRGVVARTDEISSSESEHPAEFDRGKLIMPTWPGPEISGVMVRKGKKERSEDFYEWARGRTAFAREIPVKMTLKRKWLWPKIKEARNGRIKDMLFASHDMLQCDVVFEKWDEWPEYKCFWEWLKGVAKRLWYGPDMEK